MVTSRTERIALIALQVFAAVSAAAGGIGLIGGGIDLPAEWLDGTLFSSYVVPGLILGVVAGGSQVVALAAMLRRHEWSLFASGIAGGVMMGWIIGEVLIVGSEAGVMRDLQVLYFAIGLLEVGLAAVLLRAHPAQA